MNDEYHSGDGGSMLELKNISFTVSDEENRDKEIIKDISLTLEDDKFIAITGPRWKINTGQDHRRD